jgi:glycosyltransferase involved in cell wall biosynthesis
LAGVLLSSWGTIKAFFRRAIGRRRVLVIDDYVPTEITGAGAPRAAAFQRAIVASGAHLTLLPASGDPDDADQARSLLPARALALGYGMAGIRRFIAECRDQFDVIIVSRPHNMIAFRRIAVENPGLVGRAAVVYDAEALFAEREALRHQVLGRPWPAAEVRRRTSDEIKLAQGSRIVLTVSEPIAEVFRATGHADVRVLGHAVAPQPSRNSFAERKDILFVGPTYSSETPNTDSIVWFADEVLPRICRGLRRKLPLVVVGTCAVDAIAERDDGRVKIRGAVPKLASTYARARIFVAPTRFASGLPMKVHHAAAHGVPAVVTPVLAQQLGWTHEQEVLVAESPRDFAAACLRLYRDKRLWSHIRSNALKRVAQDCDLDRFDQIVAGIVSDAGNPWREFSEWRP